MPEHDPRNEDNSAHGCNSSFSDIDGDNEAKLMECSFKFYFFNNCILLFIHNNSFNSLYFICLFYAFKFPLFQLYLFILIYLYYILYLLYELYYLFIWI